MNDDQRIRELLDRSRRITVLTGAGISTESGIPDFKSMDKSWSFEAPRETMLSVPFWRKDPRRFWEVYRSTLRHSATDGELDPGSFHRWLVELEAKDTTLSVRILTQNVDGLHGAAGSSWVIEAHGNSSRAICVECLATVPMSSLDSDPLPTCSVCGFPPLKPDISLFFEGVKGIGRFKRAIHQSDLLIVAGTSLRVGPVNELPYYAQLNRRIPTLWISDEPAPEGYEFSHSWRGKIAEFTEQMSV